MSLMSATISSVTSPALAPRDAATRRVASLACGLLLLAASTVGPTTLAAQGTPRHAETGLRAPRVLKWTLLAASVTMGLWAYRESNRADDAYAELRRLCEADQSRCTLANGAYPDAQAEALYEASNTGDRRARVALLAGQATLLGSAAFFIVDLRHGGPPENIPYDPPARTGAAARLRVGLRLPLP